MIPRRTLKPTLSMVKPQPIVTNQYQLPQTLGNPPEQVLNENNYIFDHCMNEFGSQSTLAAHALKTLGCAARHQFIGYRALLDLSQSPKIQLGVEIIADEVIKNGFKFERVTEEGSLPEIEVEALEADAVTFKISEKIHTCDIYSAYFGGCLLYVDTGSPKPR